MDFAVEGEIKLMFARYHHQALRFEKLERHLNVTQAFVPLGGAASIMVVAGPVDPSDPETRPGPEDIRAFYAEGSVGLMLWKGTWHALTRFPAHPPGAAFAMITGRDTQDELEKQLADGSMPRHTQLVDFAASAGLSLSR